MCAHINKWLTHIYMCIYKVHGSTCTALPYVCIQLAPFHFRPVKEIGRSWRNVQRNWSAYIGKTKTLLLQHSRSQLMLWSWNALVGEVRFLSIWSFVVIWSSVLKETRHSHPGHWWRPPLSCDILWLLRKKVPESYWEDKEVMRVAVKTDYKARL